MATSISGARAHTRVAERLERLITEQRLQAGDRLPSLRSLAAEYGVSQVVVRAALLALEERGVVTVRHGSGTYVQNQPGAVLSRSATLLVQMNESSLLDLYQVRQALEVLAASLAAQHATAEELAAMRECLEAIATLAEPNAASEEAVYALMSKDMGFHATIGEASHNRPLNSLLDMILPMIRRARIALVEETGGWEQFLRPSTRILREDDHMSILNAIASGDASGAELFMRKHLQRSLAGQRALIRSSGR